MKLLFISEANLRDRLFVRDFIHNIKTKDKLLVIHDSFGGTVKDTRFVTKRLSSLLSEAMVYNNAFVASQRGLFAEEEGKYIVNSSLIRKLLYPIQLLLVGPIIKRGKEEVLADPLRMMRAAREALDIDNTVVFAGNPLSPLANRKPLIQSQDDVNHWKKAYEEESKALELALSLQPATVASPMNFWK